MVTFIIVSTLSAAEEQQEVEEAAPHRSLVVEVIFIIKIFTEQMFPLLFQDR